MATVEHPILQIAKNTHVHDLLGEDASHAEHSCGHYKQEVLDACLGGILLDLLHSSQGSTLVRCIARPAALRV